ncbi:MAG: hypothetical protein JSR80_02845 [Verrucomicrobia bacterium]|nr:hypothetical protein [Verrucomicrobiota bacterium]
MEGFLKNVEGLSDQEYQERVWIRGEGPECDDLSESICLFFDLGESIFEKPKEYGLSDAQYAQVMELQEKLDDFIGVEASSPEEELQTPQWKEIRELSKKTLQAFGCHS